eukprot:IDg20185t1
MAISMFDAKFSNCVLRVEKYWGIKLALKEKWLSKFRVAQGEHVLDFMHRVCLVLKEDLSFVDDGEENDVLAYWNDLHPVELRMVNRDNIIFHASFAIAHTAKVVVSTFRIRREQDEKRRQQQNATPELRLSLLIAENKLFAALAPAFRHRVVAVALLPRSFQALLPSRRATD